MNNWCDLCRAPIKKNPHKHCTNCQAPPEAIDRREGYNGWDPADWYVYKCNICKHTWKSHE